MKNKLFLTMTATLLLAGLFMMACSMDVDTTVPVARNVDSRGFATIKPSAAENVDIRFDEREKQFFVNQARALSLLDEVKSPFRFASEATNDERTGIYRYCESFAGIWIDEDGNLNIGVVQDIITSQAELSMNRLRGQVIYRQNAFSYNFLQQIKDAIVPLMSAYKISSVGIVNKSNTVNVYLTCENNAESVRRHLKNMGMFEEAAINFVVDKGLLVEPTNGPVFGGGRLYRNDAFIGTAGVNAMCNETGRLGILTNAHLAPAGRVVLSSASGPVIGTVERAIMGGRIDAAFIPFNDPTDWQTWESTPHARHGSTTFTNIRLGNTIPLFEGMSVLRIGAVTGITTGRITRASETVQLTLRDDSSIILSNVFSYSNIPEFRDSGGPVFFNDGTNLHLIGLNTGRIIGVGIIGLFVPNRGVACRIGHVMTGLNVTPITNDTFWHTIVDGNIRIIGLNIARSDFPVGRLSIPNQIHGRYVWQIGASAFAGRTGITRVTIPSSVSRVMPDAFLNTGIWNSTPDNSVVYAGNWAVGHNGFVNNSAGELILLDNTVGIADSAFSGVPNLREVIIPRSIRRIGTGAFANNTSFQRIWIPSTVGYIGANAFAGCSSLSIFAQVLNARLNWNPNWNPNNRPVAWNSPAPFIGTPCSVAALFNGGSGTQSDPFLIANSVQLSNLRRINTQGLHFRITDFIYMGANDIWTPIPEFRGTLDGNWNGITNLRINSIYEGVQGENLYVGLFRKNYGTISRLSVTARVSVYEPDAHFVFIGVIAGINYGTIDRCFTYSYQGWNGDMIIAKTLPWGNYPSIVDSLYAGGIAGKNGINGSFAGVITNCINYGDITLYINNIGSSCGISPYHLPGTTAFNNHDFGGHFHYWHVPPTLNMPFW